MRTLVRNKQQMYYACVEGTVPVYQRDNEGKIIYSSYIDDEGNVIYYTDENGDKIPLDTGEYETSYSVPTPFKGALNAKLSDALTRAWGSDNSNNYATLILGKRDRDDNGKLIDLPNGTLIWREAKLDKSRLVYPSEDLYPRDDLFPISIINIMTKDNALYVVDGVMDEGLNEVSYYLRKMR